MATITTSDEVPRAEGPAVADAVPVDGNAVRAAASEEEDLVGALGQATIASTSDAPDTIASGAANGAPASPSAASSSGSNGVGDGRASFRHHRHASVSELARQAANPLDHLNHWRTDTREQMAKLDDGAVVVEAEYTPAEVAQMEELRAKVGPMLQDPKLMVATSDDYPGNMWQHWTNCWPQGANHPQFVDNVSHLDADSTRWPQHELIRFLRARDMNMKKAVKMLFNYKRWRIVWGASHIASFSTMPFEPAIKSILSHSYHKLDTKGRPLYLQRSGLIDPVRFANEMSLMQISVGHTWFCEEMRKRCELGSRLTGRRVNDIVNIIDIKGLGLGARKMLPMFSTTSFIDQNFYPETLGCLYIVNSPSFFPPIFNLCKAFLSAKTQEKIKILGSQYQATVLADLGAECLPVEYGGTCACEGGCCAHALGPGYTRPGEDGAIETAITIKAGQAVSHEVAYTPTVTWTPEEGGGEDSLEVWWTVELAAKDVDFSVEFKPTPAESAASSSSSSEAAVPVAPVTRLVHASSGPSTTGTYSSPLGGTLRLTFSNEYSRWNSKTLKLRTGSRIVVKQE